MAGDSKENTKNSPKSRSWVEVAREMVESISKAGGNRPTGGGDRRDAKVLDAEMKSFPEKKKKK